MKKMHWVIAAVITATVAGQAFAATRVMRGTSIMGGKDVIVGDRIYDVDFGYGPTTGWVTPELFYPGPASVFATRDEAAEALTAIHTQLIGNGAASPSAYSIVSIGDYFGFPEQKRFGIAQLYGDTLGPGQANAVYANFVTEILFAPGPKLIGTKAEMSAVQDFESTIIPAGRVEGYAFPVWTFKGMAPSVPEPSTSVLAGLGLLFALLNGAKRRVVPKALA